MGLTILKRTIETSYRKEGPIYILEFKGTGFLWQMIRRIVGSIVDYTKGELSENEILSALNGETILHATPSSPITFFSMISKQIVICTMMTMLSGY